jgi:hypothetical protein
MRVVFSRLALAELDDILGFITPNSPGGEARYHIVIAGLDPAIHGEFHPEEICHAFIR